MKSLLSALVAVAFLGGAAVADPWKDESGKYREKYRGDYADYDREYKEEFWVGNCKIERKWEKDGYKEERKCKGDWD